MIMHAKHSMAPIKSMSNITLVKQMGGWRACKEGLPPNGMHVPSGISHQKYSNSNL